jgi:hypothetical protein
VIKASYARDQGTNGGLILSERDKERRSVIGGTPHVLSRKIRRAAAPLSLRPRPPRNSVYPNI